jgi:hypothetical protein
MPASGARCRTAALPFPRNGATASQGGTETRHTPAAIIIANLVASPPTFKLNQCVNKHEGHEGMKGGGVSHGEAGTRDWALARESLVSRTAT